MIQKTVLHDKNKFLIILTKKDCLQLKKKKRNQILTFYALKFAFLTFI